MKNKRVLYIFMALLVIVFIVLFSSVLFSVKTANLNKLGESYTLDNEGISSYFSNNIGKNIFFIDENGITNYLESSFPYINVVSIERVFPSGIILHYAERQELFSVPFDSGKFAVCDSFGKVVAIKDSNVSNLPLGSVTSNVLLETELSSVSLSDKLSGEALQNAFNVYTCFSMLDTEVQINEAEFRKLFTKIKVDGNTVNLQTSFGATVEITNCSEDLLGKVQLVYAVLNGQLSPAQLASAKVTVISPTEFILS